MAEKIKNKGLALLVLAGAQFIVVLDATITNVALPAINEALKFSSTAQLQWIITAYTLLFGGFLLLGGRLSDLLGGRRVFLIGTIIFAIASLLAGLAQDPTQIIVFRGLQGLGAALLSPAALALLLNIFKEGAERNRALGIWSAVAAGGGAVGLLLGGILTQYITWRWIFFINVPVAILIVFMALRFIPKIKPKQKNVKLDLPGAVSVTAGLMVLVYGLVKTTDYGWLSVQTFGFLAAAAVLLGFFIYNEARVKQPLMPLRIFKIRNVSVGNLMQLPITAGMFAVFFFLSIYMQEILDFSPVMTGVLNLPFTIFIAITAGITSRQIAKIAPRTVLVVGTIMTAAGLLYFSRLPLDGQYWTDLFPGIALMASGMGMTFVALTLVATSGVPQKDSGLASGLLNTSQQVGGALGLAVLTSVSTAKTNSLIAEAGGNPAVIQSALVSGFRSAFIAAAVLSVVAAFIAYFGLTKKKLPADTIKHELEHEAETFPAVPGV